MPSFHYFQTIIQFRIPYDDKGLGTPEIMNKFTCPWGGSQNHIKKSKTVEVTSEMTTGEM